MQCNWGRLLWEMGSRATQELRGGRGSSLPPGSYAVSGAPCPASGCLCSGVLWTRGTQKRAVGLCACV